MTRCDTPTMSLQKQPSRSFLERRLSEFFLESLFSVSSEVALSSLLLNRINAEGVYYF